MKMHSGFLALASSMLRCDKYIAFHLDTRQDHNGITTSLFLFPVASSLFYLLRAVVAGSQYVLDHNLRD
jgi:hypothetical protein